jgi:hypothetical protein
MAEQQGNKQGDEAYQGQYYYQGRGQQGAQHPHQHQQFYHPQMPQGVSNIYGYPMDPGWGDPHAYAVYG